MMTNRIIKDLYERGIEVVTREVNKNGVELIGITAVKGNGGVSPIIYFDDIESMLEDMPYDVVVDELVRLFTVEPDLNFNVAFLEDGDLLLDHIYVGMQRASNQDELIRMPCEEMDRETEYYLYIRGDSNESGYYSCKVTYGMLDIVDVSIEDMWARAIKNTSSETTLCSLTKMLFGLEADDDFLYVLSNKNCVQGASSLINKPLIEKFANDKGVSRIVIIPSSVDELILVPSDGTEDLEHLTALIQQVNKDEVEPRKVIGERPYIINIA